MTIRPTNLDDIADLQRVLQATELFPAEMLPDMVGGFLSQSHSEELWFTYEQAGVAIGFCYATPEQLTDGTWNMLAIAVDPSQQGSGCGGALVGHLEEALWKRGIRLLIADTSGTEAFQGTRAFYKKYGYVEEATIRNFWAAGDDKVTFVKAIL